MPSPQVTIRHAHAAIKLVIKGALRDIESAFGDDDLSIDRLKDATRQLFDEALEALAEFEIDGTKLMNLEAMLDAMQAMLGDAPDAHAVVRELLAEFHLEP